MSSARRNPLPKFQLFLILLIQVTEPITAEVIYPFIIGAVRSTGITHGDEKKAGYFAGIIESMFFLAECLTVFYWGRLSDLYGRRKILLLGPLGLSIAMLGFGISKNFVALVIFRAFQGMFNGNIGVSKTVMAEITDSTNMADAFTMLPMMWSIGSAVGCVAPALGGILASPATRWPKIFGKFAFFHNYPYFLPCAAAGCLAFIAFLFAYLGLKESSPAFKDKKRNGITSSEDTEPLLRNGEQCGHYGSNDNADGHDKLLSTRELLTAEMQITLLNYGLLSATDMAWFVLIPLFYSSSIPIGGLGLSPYQVGSILGIFAVLNGAWNLLVLRRVLKKIGPRKMYIVSYAFFLIIFPLLWIIREVAHAAGKVNALVWALIICQLFAATFVNAAWNSMSLLVIQSAPPNSLGAVNGLAQMVTSGTRGLAPLFASSLFSVSLESRLAGGHLVDIVLIALSIIGVFCSFQLPKNKL
ncbi:major facilitator superfamily domain-containing protein [Rhodocollybia butyracea]|uniref:Major facilitator superfamily domain-containing protein n=1 Tax=Rhodocollybia butyracea TaxID=206335 RepID=A0A9P5P6W4_9AGAR|nr:major facilitator superfamily domain-containing protein [Rhodocollybia butyracea]